MTALQVMVIDDSVTIRAMLEQIISADVSCRVVGVAADVNAAIAIMRTTRPDVVTLDLKIPGTDGLQFLRSIADQRHPPIIVVSSASKQGALETTAAIEAGAVACFDKANLLADAKKFRKALTKAAQTKPSAKLPRRSSPSTLVAEAISEG